MFKQKIIVPNNLKEITLGQYQRFAKINDSEQDADFYEKKMIEIFCSINLEDVNKIEYKSIKKVIGILNKMFDAKPELIHSFQIDNIKFGFHPKLDAMSFGEFVDLDTSLTDWKTMHEAMNVLYRPITKNLFGSYEIEDYMPDVNYNMKEMPLEAALSAIFFLIDLEKELMKLTRNYSQQALKQWMEVQNKDSQSSMDGIRLYGLLQEEI